MNAGALRFNHRPGQTSPGVQSYARAVVATSGDAPEAQGRLLEDRGKVQASRGRNRGILDPRNSDPSRSGTCEQNVISGLV